MLYYDFYAICIYMLYYRGSPLCRTSLTWNICRVGIHCQDMIYRVFINYELGRQVMFQNDMKHYGYTLLYPMHKNMFDLPSYA